MFIYAFLYVLRDYNHVKVIFSLRLVFVPTSLHLIIGKMPTSQNTLKSQKAIKLINELLLLEGQIMGWGIGGYKTQMTYV